MGLMAVLDAVEKKLFFLTGNGTLCVSIDCLVACLRNELSLLSFSYDEKT